MLKVRLLDNERMEEQLGQLELFQFVLRVHNARYLCCIPKVSKPIAIQRSSMHLLGSNLVYQLTDWLARSLGHFSHCA